MEFNEKLQHLRKAQGWTQEQLASKVLVSRTAVSKWENGKGYPNIDSLKSLSKLFGVSLDDLLSNEELLDLAQEENRSNLNRLTTLVYGSLDILVLTFLFLPLYIRQDEDMVRTVSLFAKPDVSDVTWVIYFAIPLVMAIIGICELLAVRFSSSKSWQQLRLASIFIAAGCVLIFIATRQPYPTTLLFLFLMIKIVLMIKPLKNQ
ncbi:helix-turn-helix domain-containing protein [Enterococcus sp. LJL90]